MIKVKVLYFGMIAELCGKSESIESIEVGLTSNDLKNKVLKEYPKVQEIAFSMAVNQNMTTENKDLNEGDEIAFFPPFAGG